MSWRGLHKNYESGCRPRRREFTSKLKLHLIVNTMVFVGQVVLLTSCSLRIIYLTFSSFAKNKTVPLCAKYTGLQ